MTLYEAEKGATCLIKGLYVEPAITRRLQALGLNDGTTVNVLNRKRRGAMIIQVRGTRLALGKHISSNIEISLESFEAKQERTEARWESPDAKKGESETKQENIGTAQRDLDAKQKNAGGSRQEVYK